MDGNETSFFLQAALFALAGLSGYLSITSIRFSLLRAAVVLLGLLPGVVLMGAIAAVRVSDGSLAGPFGFVALLAGGFSLSAGLLLARRLAFLPEVNKGQDDDA